MEKPQIGVLDCNNFFVSCERLFRPDLIGKPVVVLSSNDGNVVARSQEVKDMNVPMGVPYFQIKDTLKEYGVTTFSSHLALYRDISRRVFEVMREEIEIVEQYSVDEAFFIVDGDTDEVANRVKAAVEKQVGIPVSVGIAATKTLAKLASHKAKKNNGIFILTAPLWRALSNDVRLSEMWGVGGKLEMRYKKHSLLYARDFIEADSSRISSLFGVNGVRLQHELQGVSVMSLGQKLEPQKSITSTRSFEKETYSIDVLADAVAYHMRHATADLRAMGMKTATVRVLIQTSRFGDFFLRGGSKDEILTVPTNNSIQLLRIAHELLEKLYEPAVLYKKAGVVLSQFVPAEIVQKTLFKEQSTYNSTALMDTIDKLNNKEGREVVLLGSRLLSTKWRYSPKASSPAYTTRWSDVVNVNAN
ncbi:MAG: Y-family DNA polymerase [Candidatus Pacebacteria bacterium]|nr:Y-family DNA polymerase [Candidatus Paceibacterota bacterium]